MKQLLKFGFSFTVLSFFVFSGCNEKDDIIEFDYYNQSKVLNLMVKNATINHFQTFPTFLKEDNSFNQQKAIRSTLRFLDNNYFNNQIGEYEPFLVGINQLSNLGSNSSRKSSSNQNLENFLDNEEIEFVNGFITSVMEVNKPLLVKDLSDEYKIMLENSSFSNEQKVELLAIIETFGAMAELLSDQSFINSFRNSLGINTNGRLLCDEDGIEEERDDEDESNRILCGQSGIDWKGVWQSAVLTGAASGSSAAYVGATTGTVTFPLVGTVTGGVSAGVIGFTSGFVSGAAIEVGRQLIFD